MSWARLEFDSATLCPWQTGHISKWAISLTRSSRLSAAEIPVWKIRNSRVINAAVIFLFFIFGMVILASAL
jgi:hypothetical protein